MPDLSSCCSAPVIVTGDTTRHWECRACGMPCDILTAKHCWVTIFPGEAITFPDRTTLPGGLDAWEF